MNLPPARTAVVCLLLVASSVAWRRGTLFSGSLDAVVVAKALLSVVALLVVLLSGRWRTGTRRLGTGSLWLLALLLASSALGALTAGTLLASGAVAARVVVLAVTVTLLLRTAPVLEVLGGLVWACGAIGAVAAATGLAHEGRGGRLFGGIPPLNPNELALLAGVVVLWCAWRAVLGEARWGAALAGLAGTAVVYLTGSRTALLVLVAAVAAMALYLRRARVGLVVGALVTAAVGVVGLAATGAVTEFLSRDGVGDSTLDSRFIAWDAAVSWARSGWQVAFGGGLSVKKIPVSGQAWDDQLLDSSWVSALVQAGLLGLLVAVVWAVWSLRGALRAPRAHRVLVVGLLVLLLGRSTVESGLFDATPAFLLFLAVSAAVEGGTRRRLAGEERDAAPLLEGSRSSHSGAPAAAAS